MVTDIAGERVLRLCTQVNAIMQEILKYLKITEKFILFTKRLEGPMIGCIVLVSL